MKLRKIRHQTAKFFGLEGGSLGQTWRSQRQEATLRPLCRYGRYANTYRASRCLGSQRCRRTGAYAVTAANAALALATRFHETYERLAPLFGYETRLETRTFDATTPNGKLMVAVCAALMEETATRSPTVRVDDPPLVQRRMTVARSRRLPVTAGTAGTSGSSRHSPRSGCPTSAVSAASSSS